MPDFTKIDDTAVSISGDGLPVILVHGMGLNQLMWSEQLPQLNKQFRVLTYDLLGHGQSRMRQGTYVMGDFVDQLARIIDQMHIKQCALVGFSLGGLIAQAFTLAHPDLINRLVILNSGYDRSPEERSGMIKRLEIARKLDHGATVEMALERWFTREFLSKRPDVIQKVRRWMLANHPGIYSEIYRVLTYGDKPLARAIAAIKCPTLVLTCENDIGNSPSMARRAVARIPNAQLAIVPLLKHMGLMEAPDRINEILVPFLEAKSEVNPK